MQICKVLCLGCLSSIDFEKCVVLEEATVCKRKLNKICWDQILRIQEIQMLAGTSVDFYVLPEQLKRDKLLQPEFFSERWQDTILFAIVYMGILVGMRQPQFLCRKMQVQNDICKFFYKMIYCYNILWQCNVGIYLCGIWHHERSIKMWRGCYMHNSFLKRCRDATMVFTLLSSREVQHKEELEAWNFYNSSVKLIYEITFNLEK